MPRGLLATTQDELDTYVGQLLPGEHIVFLGGLDGGIYGRRKGLILRDTCLLVTSVGVQYAYLLRRPVEESLVHNLIKYGEGVLNVPLCRVTADASAWQPKVQTGRFPSNVLLVHQEGCHVDGERRVHSGKTPEVLGERVSGLYNIGTDRKLPSAWMSKCYGDESGLETLANWVCADDCPAKQVDAGEGNTRYHPQFKTYADAVTWLRVLAGA